MANLTLNGDASANSIIGGIGNDSLFGFAGDDTLEGAAGNDVLDGGLGIDLLKGGAGNDTYIITDADDTVLELVGAGKDTVLAAVDYVLTVNVDNLTLTDDAIAGTGNTLANLLTGNDLDNSLDGAAGNDTLDGGIGADTLIGGAGDDLYIIDDANDEVVEATVGTAGGKDTVQSSVSFELSANVENLTLTGTDDIDAIGNDTANTLTGNSGINLLDGGAGADTLKGGDGDDTYGVNLKKVGNTAVFEDTVTELANQGVDTIVLSGDIDNTIANTITLGATIENLFADDSNFTKLNFTGNTLANEIHGNDADNKILGLAGADTLLGGGGNDTLDGGIGIDSLVGGSGDDAYLLDLVVTGTGVSTAVSNTFIDTFTESVNGGSDTISLRGTATLSTAKVFDLNNYINIENINASATLSTKINLTGNALDNALTGNSAANTLIGGLGNDTLDGGAGNDNLNGGDGDDTYVISAAGDVIVTDTEGTDTVVSAVSFSIAARDDLENITLSGTAATATGNEGTNILTGNAAANILDGGADIDTLIGGAGNDTYIVDDANDEVVELTAGGTDTIKSSVSYELGDNLENLTLTGGENIDAIGNALVNTLIGNSGENLLDGGLGADILKGGDGNDTYAVNLKAVGSVVSMGDTVTELANQGTDTIVLSGSIITGTASTIILSANVENLYAEDTGITKLNITGNVLANEIQGNEADNKLDGGAGNDSLIGGAGSDTLLGGAGLDVLTGGIGKDLLTGGLGSDTFDFNSILDSAVGVNRDVISDFSHTQLDLINLLDIDADILTNGDQAFSFITGAFTNVAGQLHFSAGILSGDTNGDGAADFEIALTGLTTLVAGDFVL